MINLKFYETFRFKIAGYFVFVLLPVVVAFVITAEYLLFPAMEQNIKQQLTNSTRVLVTSIRANASAIIRNQLKVIAEKNLDIAEQQLALVDQGLLSKSEAINRLKNIFLSQHIGRSGYIYCIDQNGFAVIHPNKDVENTDNKRFDIVREQLKQKEGYIEYSWRNPGEEMQRQKALYMVQFKPLGWIISVSTYRSEFYELLDPLDFQEAVSSLKFGESGYAFVFTKDQKILIHPDLPYLTELSQIASASHISSQMLSRGKGIIEYDWPDHSDGPPRKKIAVFETMQEYGWTVVSSAYLDEVMKPITVIRNLGYILIAVITIVAAIAVFFFSGRLNRPITAMLKQLDQNTKNSSHSPLPVISHDELGILAQEFNYFSSVIESQKAQLEHERERYRFLFETSPDAIFLLRGLTITDCNPATCEIFGGDRSTLLGRSVADLSPSEQAEGENSLLLAQQLTYLSAEHGFQSFEWIHKTIDGRLFNAEVRLKTFEVDNGEQILVAFLRDITERKQVEESLRLTQFAFDRAAIAIFRVGDDARILNVNEQACKDLGYSASELCQMTIFDINPGMKPDNWVGTRKNLRAEKVLNFKTEHRKKDGSLLSVEITSNLLEFRGKYFSISFARDITEQIMSEKALRLTQFAFDRAAIGIFQLDSAGRVLSVNNQACKDLGYTESELSQMTIFDFNPTVNYPEWEDIWKTVLDQKYYHLETEHRRKDGTIFPVEITSNLLEFEDELYTICFVLDISVRINNAKLRAKMQADLQQAQRLDSLGTLAGGIAHDFNNILSAIIGYTELTKMDCSDNPKAQNYLDQIDKASFRAKRLVQQILGFSRQSNLDRYPLNIGKTVHEALSLIRATIPTNIEITKNIPADLGVVFANETQLHQVVMNLCTNASHAIDTEGGTISVSLRPLTLCSKDAITFHALAPGEYIELTISDTGSGIPAEILPKIFDPFFSTKTPEMGTGLGLSTVHGIIKDHGGIVKVYSELSIGTIFQILLPTTTVKLEKSDLSTESLPQGNETILLIDDETWLLEIGKEFLESLGYQVETWASSTDALEAYRIQPTKYDLIVSDMTMPKLTGERLAVEIKKIQPNVPIILCTGFSARLNLAALQNTGIDKILMKPFTYNELAINVREILDRYQLAFLQKS